MIAAVAREVAVRVAEAGELIGALRPPRVIHHVGNAKAEEIGVKTDAVVPVRQVETEMAETPDLERPI
jgi:hypothetical protein